MAKYTIFNTGAGEVILSVRALGKFHMSTRLSLIANGMDTILVGTTKDGIDKYPLDAATVALLRSAPTSSNPPSLLFQCGAVYYPGQARKWGWGMRVARNDVVLPCVSADGVQQPLDAHGFRRTGLRSFPADNNVTVGFDLITFA